MAVNKEYESNKHEIVLEQNSKGNWTLRAGRIGGFVGTLGLNNTTLGEVRGGLRETIKAGTNRSMPVTVIIPDRNVPSGIHIVKGTVGALERVGVTAKQLAPVSKRRVLADRLKRAEREAINFKKGEAKAKKRADEVQRLRGSKAAESFRSIESNFRFGKENAQALIPKLRKEMNQERIRSTKRKALFSR